MNSNAFIQNRRPRQGGFTVLELVVSIAILAIILLIVYQSFSAVVNSTEDTRLASFEIRTRQFLHESFETNLAQTTEGWSPGSAYRLSTMTEGQETDEIAVDGSVMRYRFSGEAESMSFVSSAPLAADSGLPGQMKLVIYEAVDGSTEENFAHDFGVEAAMTLQVTESPLGMTETGLGGGLDFGDLGRDSITQAAEESGMDSAGWDIPIESISFQYFDGDDWLERWDSTEVGRLPWAVDIRINFPTDDEAPEELDRDRDEEPDLRLVITVPIGAGIRDTAPEYVRPGESSRETT